jgi:hypothetical protein
MSAALFEAAFAAAGFVLRGSRASCPFCEGHSRQTVAIKGGLWHCHRCLRGGHIAKLAREQGIELPAPRERRANIPKTRFREWLAEKMVTLSNREHRLRRSADSAIAALTYFPEMDTAWGALAEYYNSRHLFERFWQSASDKVGRYWLYRQWRRYGN